jgi:hypothetical protein
VRLVGYNLIMILLGLRPMVQSRYLWLMYGLLSAVIGTMNAQTVNSIGSMDPRYAGLASEVAKYRSNADVVATNSFHILDLNAGVPSVPVANYDDAAQYKWFLWVTLPRYDPIATSVFELERPPAAEWCKDHEFEGAILFERCSDVARSHPHDEEKR